MHSFPARSPLHTFLYPNRSRPQSLLLAPTQLCGIPLFLRLIGLWARRTTRSSWHVRSIPHIARRSNKTHPRKQLGTIPTMSVAILPYEHRVECLELTRPMSVLHPLSRRCTDSTRTSAPRMLRYNRFPLHRAHISASRVSCNRIRARPAPPAGNVLRWDSRRQRHK